MTFAPTVVSFFRCMSARKIDAGGSLNHHEVTVEAFDGDTQAPIEGAHVLLHPYRGLTDERGVAKVKVAKGRYTLFVSGFNYIGHERIIDVASDVTARAELAVEPEEEVDIR